MPKKCISCPTAVFDRSIVAPLPPPNTIVDRADRAQIAAVVVVGRADDQILLVVAVDVADGDRPQVPVHASPLDRHVGGHRLQIGGARVGADGARLLHQPERDDALAAGGQRAVGVSAGDQVHLAVVRQRRDVRRPACPVVGVDPERQRVGERSR